MFDVPLPLGNIDEDDEMVSIFRGNSLNRGASLLIENSELNKRINKVSRAYNSPINKIKSSQKQIKGLYNKVNKRISDVIQESGLTTNALEFEKEGFKTLSSLISTEITAIDKEEKFVNDKHKAVIAERKQYFSEQVVVGNAGGAIGNGIATSAANYANVMGNQGMVASGGTPTGVDSFLLNGGSVATNMAPTGYEPVKLATDKENENVESTDKKGEGENFSKVVENNEGISATNVSMVVPTDEDIDKMNENRAHVTQDGMIGELEENFAEDTDLAFNYAATCLDLRNKNVESVMMYDPKSGKYWGATRDTDNGVLIEGYTEHINLLKPRSLDMTTGTCINVQGAVMKVEVADIEEMPDIYVKQWSESEDTENV